MTYKYFGAEIASFYIKNRFRLSDRKGLDYPHSFLNSSGTYDQGEYKDE